jgi:bacterial/archaeal transporter family protein
VRGRADLGWQFYAALALVVWGFWGYLPKRALLTLDPRSVLVLEGVGGALVALAVLISRGFRAQADAAGTLAAIATGICGLGGAYFFLLALERGKASAVVPFTSLYPVVTLALSVLLLREHPSPTNLAGVVLAVVAVVLLSMGGN